MKVGYNPGWGVFIIVMGGCCFLLGLLSTALDSFDPLVIFAPLLMVIGILQLVQPYFVYDPRSRSIAVKALIGTTMRTFGGAAGGTLTVEGDRIVVVRPDGSRKVPVSRAMAKRADWDAVLAQLS